MKNSTATPAAVFVPPTASASMAYFIAMVHAMYTTSIPVAPVKNMVRLLNLGEIRAIVVPFTKLHAVFPRLIIDLVLESVMPIISRILLR